MWQVIKNFFGPTVKPVSGIKATTEVKLPSLVSRVVSAAICDHTFVFKNQGWVLSSPDKPRTKKTYALMNNVVCSKCNTSKYVAIS
jgi:hypothetical protein